MDYKPWDPICGMHIQVPNHSPCTFQILVGNIHKITCAMVKTWYVVYGHAS